MVLHRSVEIEKAFKMVNNEVFGTQYICDAE